MHKILLIILYTNNYDSWWNPIVLIWSSDTKKKVTVLQILKKYDN